MGLSFEQITSGVYRLKVPLTDGLWTGVYLVQDVSGIFLIDSACGKNDVDHLIIPALRDIHLEIQDVDYLLCTHTHADHIGGHARICELHPGIRTVTWAAAVDKMRDPLKYNIKIRQVFPEYSAPPSVPLCGVEPKVLISAGETLCGRLQLIHTPGHDSDALCWLDVPSGTLFSGDSLQAYGTASVGIALIMNLPDYQVTLQTLEKRNEIRFIATGHPFRMANHSEKSMFSSNVLLSECRAAIADYREYVSRRLEAVPDDNAQLASDMIRYFGGVVPRYLFLPLYTFTEIKKQLMLEVNSNV